MAHEEALRSITTVAGAGALQYRVVKTFGACVLSDDPEADYALGILQNDPATGEEATVGIDGVSKAEAGAVVAKDALLMWDSVGRVITWTAAAGANAMHIGIAKEAAGAAGDIIPVLIMRGISQADA